MRFPSFLAIALLSALSPLAVADTITTIVNTSITLNISSPNDNFYGSYSTAHPGGIIGYPTLGNASVTLDIPDFSIFLPMGSAISSATASVITPTGAIQGTGYLYTEGRFPPPDQGSPSTAPTFTDTGSSSVQVGYVHGAVRPTIDGNEVSIDDASVILGYLGTIQGFVDTPGVNWNGYIGGSGQVTIPYSVELDITYSMPSEFSTFSSEEMSAVPEPSTFALLAPGVLGVIGVVRRRYRRV